MQKLSDENEFDLHENGPVGGKHFHMNGFARRLQRQLEDDLFSVLISHHVDQTCSPEHRTSIEPTTPTRNT